MNDYTSCACLSIALNIVLIDLLVALLRLACRWLFSPDVNDPGFRNVSFDELVGVYSQSTRAIVSHRSA
jgi:hypothetical protein